MKINSLSSSLVLSILISSSAFSVIPSNHSVVEFFESNTNEMNLYKLGASDSSDVLIDAVLAKSDASSVKASKSTPSEVRVNDIANQEATLLEHESDIKPVYVDWSDNLHHNSGEYEYLASVGASW